MASVQHIVTGITNPASAPPSAGAHYINTITGQKWCASGTELVGDWGLPLPGAAQISGTDVSELLVPADGTVCIWRVSAENDRALNFTAQSTPGLYVAEVVIENTQATSLSVSVYTPEGGKLLNFEQQDLLPSESKYFRFHCWVGSDNVTCWSLVDSYSLDRITEAVHEYGNDVTECIFLGDQPLSFWTISDETPRSITFLLLQTTFAATRDLVIRNDSTAAITIQVSATGRPLKDTTQLSVPASSATLFRLAYYNGSGALRWSLLDSWVL